jgi:hypothetical protein
MSKDYVAGLIETSDKMTIRESGASKPFQPIRNPKLETYLPHIPIALALGNGV